jgi:replicative DNA helicase
VLIPPSGDGQAAVLRLYRALKDAHGTLERLTDQTNATLHAAALPSKKMSLAFVRAVLKSPKKLNEMISSLRKMQAEIRDCLRNLETAFNEVDHLYNSFSRSTFIPLADRVKLVSLLEKFGLSWRR